MGDIMSDLNTKRGHVLGMTPSGTGETKIEAMVHMAGIMVLGVVMILVTLHDFHVLL